MFQKRKKKKDESFVNLPLSLPPLLFACNTSIVLFNSETGKADSFLSRIICCLLLALPLRYDSYNTAMTTSQNWVKGSRAASSLNS